MRTKPFAIALMLLFTAFSTAGQYLLKLGAESFNLSITSLLTNYHVMLGLLFYGAAAALMLTAMKHAELSVIYPFVALSYVWVALGAFLFLKENLLITNWLGIALIVSGVGLVGYGAEHG